MYQLKIQEDDEDVTLAAFETTGVFLLGCAQAAAAAIDLELQGSLRGDSALLERQVQRWAKTLEVKLLEALSRRGVPGAAELKAARLPQVESLEAVRDDSGRITHTIKRFVADPRALEP